MSCYVVRRVYKTEESIAGSLETEKNLKKTIRELLRKISRLMSWTEVWLMIEYYDVIDPRSRPT
jgi:hypothetical protein